MKLVIDMPEEKIEWIKENNPNANPNSIVGAIVNGTPYKERPKGKWVDYLDEGFVECPFCESATNCDGNKDELHYCFSCGAELI